MVFPWEEWSKRFEGRARAPFLQRSHLLSQSQVFGGQAGPPDQARPSESDKLAQGIHHHGLHIRKPASSYAYAEGWQCDLSLVISRATGFLPGTTVVGRHRSLTTVQSRRIGHESFWPISRSRGQIGGSQNRACPGVLVGDCYRNSGSYAWAWVPKLQRVSVQVPTHIIRTQLANRENVINSVKISI